MEDFYTRSDGIQKLWLSRNIQKDFPAINNPNFKLKNNNNRNAQPYRRLKNHHSRSETVITLTFYCHKRNKRAVFLIHGRCINKLQIRKPQGHKHPIQFPSALKKNCCVNNPTMLILISLNLPIVYLLGVLTTLFTRE